MAMRAFKLLLPALLLGLLSSCGGRGGDAKKEGASRREGSPALDRAREAAEEGRAAAEKAEAEKYAKPDWDKAEAAYEDALALVEEGEANKAKARFTSANSIYRKAADAAERNKRAYGALEKEKGEAESLRDKAKQAGADQVPEGAYSFGVAALKKAEEELASGSFTQARGQLRQAKTDFENALRDVEQSKKEIEGITKLRKEVEEEQKLMLEKQKLAQEQGADSKRAYDFGMASDAARQGEKLLEEAAAALADAKIDFEEKRQLLEDARENFRSARMQYLQIVESIQSDKAVVEVPGVGPQPGPESDDVADSKVQHSPEPEEEEKKNRIPADLDGLIEANLDKLFSGPAEYKDGRVSIDYTDGALLKKDVLRDKGAFLKYVWSELGSKEDMSIWAGGQGYVFLKPRFRREVAVYFDCDVQLVDPGGSLSVEVLSDGKVGYGSLFGVYAGEIRSGKFTSPARTTFEGAKGAPQHWVERKAVHKWGIRVNWPEGEKYGKITAVFDEEDVSAFPKVDREIGLIGFRWSSTKFRAKHLRVEGFLDPKWAVEELKKKGVAVTGDAQGEAGPKEKKESGRGEKKPAGKKPELPF